MQQDFSLIQVCFQVMINKADSSPAQQTGTAQQIKKLHLLHSPIYQSAFFFCDRKCLNVAFVRKKNKANKIQQWNAENRLSRTTDDYNKCRHI